MNIFAVHATKSMFLHILNLMQVT